MKDWKTVVGLFCLIIILALSGCGKKETPAPAKYTLTTEITGEGSVSVDPEKEFYGSGEAVTLTAVAEEGWKFSGWSGDATGTESQVTIVMDRNKSVTAVFEKLSSSEPLFREDFDAAGSEEHFFSTAYRSIPGDPGTPMYYLTGGHVEFVDGQITIGIGDKGGRFTVGQTITEKDTTAAGVEPNGIFDLSKPYKISLKVIGVSGTLSKKFQVYVDNNTTNSDKSFHGSASKVYEKKLEDFTENEEVVISLSVGTAHSFIQVRVESGGYITFDDLVIEYIE